MGFASSRVRVRFSYIIVVVSFLAAVFSYGFSVWSASRRYDAALPKDASDSVIRGVLAFHQGAGNFPKDFVEVEEAVWKHKKPPNFGETGRTFNAYNYNYIYFRRKRVSAVRRCPRPLSALILSCQSTAD